MIEWIQYGGPSLDVNLTSRSARTKQERRVSIVKEFAAGAPIDFPCVHA